MQHFPRADGIAVSDNPVPVWRPLQCGDGLPIHRRTETHRTRDDLPDGEKVAERLRAAHVADVALREHELRQPVYTLRVQKWFGDEIDRVSVATINQQVVTGFAGLNEHGVSAVQR